MVASPVDIPDDSSLKEDFIGGSSLDPAADAATSCDSVSSGVVSAGLCSSPTEAGSGTDTPTRNDLKKFVKSSLPGGFAAQTIFGTGRRKCAVARVVLKEGTGRVIINYRDVKEYLQGNPLWILYVTLPLKTVRCRHKYDVFVKAHGGGLSGQAQAACLGVARALLKVDEGYRKVLRGEMLLIRDPRVVEPKKVGRKKARKRPQYSKR